MALPPSAKKTCDPQICLARAEGIASHPLFNEAAALAHSDHVNSCLGIVIAYILGTEI